MADQGAATGAATTPPAPPLQAGTRRPRLAPGPNFPEVVAEVDGPKAYHLLWMPTMNRLRPRWDWTKLPRGSTSEAGLAQVPAFAGMHIIINSKERWARVMDPLGAKENQKLMVEVTASLKKIFGDTYTHVPPFEQRGMDDNMLATWLYWLWREVIADKMRIVRGRIITLEEIAEAMPKAKIRRNFLDSLAYRKTEGEEPVEKVSADFANSWAGDPPPE
jgi:hypothetical protein